MTSLTIEQVIEEGFSLVPRLEGRRLMVRVAGNGDMNAIEVLSDHLRRVHREALRCYLDEVVYDFEELYFLNSRCLKAFVTWIDTVRSEGGPYKIRLVANPNQHWQRHSLGALRKLAMDVVTVEQTVA